MDQLLLWLKIDILWTTNWCNPLVFDYIIKENPKRSIDNILGYKKLVESKNLLYKRKTNCCEIEKIGYDINYKGNTLLFN